MALNDTGSEEPAIAATGQITWACHVTPKGISGKLTGARGYLCMVLGIDPGELPNPSHKHLLHLGNGHLAQAAPLPGPMSLEKNERDLKTSQDISRLAEVCNKYMQVSEAIFQSTIIYFC